MQKKAKGDLGEKLAVEYLKRNKFKIIGNNFYSQFGEIDIIAFDKKTDETVFLEVKSRATNNFGYPEEAVNKAKLVKMYKTAQVYFDKYKLMHKYRFDCLAIELDFHERKARLRHYRGIVC
ncbi:YraN family protein [Candidatus Kuenenbacteria bacterium CG11_big_fil_rev_8_21_14_0_20_37_9]|uniref:UPF0102 protein COT27_02620 n=2 Tax=Candidatus Kueneniibacteriota TaxID=1752740 RepID=A0A2M6XSB7_9BACT|nr:MAG: hypothetical protein AUJ29_03110 [Candidatus Kuenenbacteria bacterium CG1_02_38_13]PIR05332.1 MAG: YraN family protein [Candidatus Kuenenbacteria bacterium CG11_big_fil_rev_8_21_14_0_20_37_9]PIU10526.1 MAG: YraN family protein [Candidatus Kuenenbacteria bacterium CG08_land_8_20_14_0_20_37_23]